MIACMTISRNDTVPKLSAFTFHLRMTILKERGSILITLLFLLDY